MWSLVSRLLNLWSETSSDGKPSEKEVPSLSSMSSQHKESASDHVHRRNLIGMVTSVHDDYGLVNDSIYFNFSVVVGPVLPKVGHSVLVNAKSESYAEGWVAESVQVMSESWENVGSESVVSMENRSNVHHAVVGRITNILRQNQCYINKDLCINLQEAKVIDFQPAVGDWITVGSASDENEGSLARAAKYEMKPLRSRNFRGTVTALKLDFGLVDDNICFLFKDGVDNHTFQIGDSVRGVAIESSCCRCSWRAVQIALLFSVEQHSILRHGRHKMLALAKLVQDKNNVSVSSPLDFGDMLLGESKLISASIKNEGCSEIILKSCSLQTKSHSQLRCISVTLQPSLSSESTGTLKPITKFENIELTLSPDDVAHVDIECKASNLGKFRDLLTFEFEGFQIGRPVFVRIQDPRHQLLKPSSHDYSTTSGNMNSSRESSSNRLTRDVHSSDWVLPGRMPVYNGPRLPIHLSKYPVPRDLIECHQGNRELLTWRPILSDDLNFKNYKDKFSTLLHLEEIQRVEDMKQFDMYRVCLSEMGEFLALEVPGLAEGRPSVLVGDKVLLEDPDEVQEPKYEGYVHLVRGEDILLKFHEDFHNRFSGKDYNVSFTLNRTTMRRCHQAVSLYSRIGPQILFPSSTNSVLGPPQLRFDPQSLGNRLLNERQQLAVRGILETRRRPAPYVIYGPPGTGKTVTLVEAVVQVFLQRPDGRILICTPSNSAADLVCERLHCTGHFSPTDMSRLNAFHRSEEDLPKAVQIYCHSSAVLEVIAHYRVIITTCTMSGILYNLGIKPGHFTHVFIDEAGQATEPEALIPICLAAAQGIPDFQIVLAGDPMQLGPVLRSKHSAKYGLQTSLLERICQAGPYLRDESKPGNYDPWYVTKLIDNYRSHPAILALSSELFYNSELVPRASSDLALSLCHWKYLPNKTFPVLFHGIRGEDLREGDSPSWFNAEEVFQVVCYVQSMYFDLDLYPEDVGIVTPYRKQVEKIKLLFESLETVCPKVGSIEEFQGQERKAMILSTVRSSDSWLDFDHNHNLGFIFNAKRFNVALTRAQALLVVIGNPFVLIKDFYWRKLVQLCIANDAYVGCDKEELIDILSIVDNAPRT